MTRPAETTPVSIEPLRFSLLNEVKHGISTRQGGVSASPYASLNMGLSSGDDEVNILANRHAFVRSLGIGLEEVATGRLCHGNGVSVCRQSCPSDLPLERVPVRPGSSSSEIVFQTDAVVSDIPGLHFLLTFADCVPLAFSDGRRGVVAAAHAGWRGTASGIGPAVVRAMERFFGTRPQDILVGIGPSIGPCCYSVHQERLDTFDSSGFEAAVVLRDNATFLDLWTANERQLVDVGVPATSIENPRICTSCNTSMFYSHRAEAGRTGRFALCIGLP